MGRKSALRILVHLDIRHKTAQDMVAGSMRYASTHPDVQVQFAGPHIPENEIDYFADWKPDAIIIDSTVQDMTKDDFDSIAGRAAVFVNTPLPHGLRHPAATIGTDERMMAVTAADLFIRKGIEHFAFVGAAASNRWNDVRRRLFRATLRERGFPLESFAPDPSPNWRERERELARWLTSLSKPCGIWTVYDRMAKNVLDACALAGLSVPGDVQILGVDNESIICEHTHPSLSSLASDFEEGGYMSVQFLHRTLRAQASGERPPKVVRLTIPFRGEVERLSTADMNGRLHHVAAAREFIRKNATANLSVEDVAIAAGVSVRLLQRDFRSVVGHSPTEEIILERLKRVKRLLVTTQTKIESIGQLCGFRSPAYLKTLFKSRFGLTMSTYRSKN